VGEAGADGWVGCTGRSRGRGGVGGQRQLTLRVLWFRERRVRVRVRGAGGPQGFVLRHLMEGSKALVKKEALLCCRGERAVHCGSAAGSRRMRVQSEAGAPVPDWKLCVRAPSSSRTACPAPPSTSCGRNPSRGAQGGAWGGGWVGSTMGSSAMSLTFGGSGGALGAPRVAAARAGGTRGERALLQHRRALPRAPHLAAPGRLAPGAGEGLAPSAYALSRFQDCNPPGSGFGALLVYRLWVLVPQEGSGVRSRSEEPVEVQGRG